MKNIIIFTAKFLLTLLGALNKLLNKINFYLATVKIYLDGNECEKFKDCLMLARLRKNQPPASDRFIEYPWLLENISLASGRLLDIGSTIGDPLAGSLPEEIEINCLNLNAKKFKNKKIIFKQGDIRATDYPDNYFDVISCISTLEHIGVAGRYHSDSDPEGDVKAMREIKRILKPGGILLATIPYGAKDVLPINKLYNKERLAGLFEGLEIVSQEFRKFNRAWHAWLKVNEAKAAETEMVKDGWYAIALIKAKKI